MCAINAQAQHAAPLVGAVCSPAVKGASRRLIDGSGGSRDGGRDVARWTVEEAG